MGLSGFNPLFIILDGVLLALIGADKFRSCLVDFTQRKEIQSLVGVEHDAVIGAPFVIQIGLIGQQCPGFMAEFDFGLLRILIYFFLRLVEGFVALVVLAVGA